MADVSSKRKLLAIVGTLTIVLVLLLAVRTVTALGTYYFLIGATGDRGSRDNVGVRAEIRTNSYNSPIYVSDTGEKFSSNYFAIAEPFNDGSTIYLGYSNYAGQVYWHWGRIDSTGDVEDSGAAPFSGSVLSSLVGLNGTWHTYSIEIDPQTTNSQRVWDLVLDGNLVGVTRQTGTERNAGTDSVFIVAEEITRDLGDQLLGPVEFRNLAYQRSDGWHQVASLKVLEYCLWNDIPHSECNVDSPYGISELGSNHVIVGSGLPRHPNGEILWTANPIEYLAPIFGSNLGLALLMIFILVILINRTIIRTAIEVNESITIRAPLKEVFELYANYANWAKMNPDLIKSVKPLREDGNEQVLEVHDMQGTHNEILRIYPNRIENEVTTRRGTRAKETHLYEPVADGTKHSVVIHLSYRGFHLKRTLVKRVSEGLRKFLEREKTVAEKP